MLINTFLSNIVACKSLAENYINDIIKATFNIGRTGELPGRCHGILHAQFTLSTRLLEYVLFRVRQAGQLEDTDKHAGKQGNGSSFVQPDRWQAVSNCEAASKQTKLHLPVLASHAPQSQGLQNAGPLLLLLGPARMHHRDIQLHCRWMATCRLEAVFW